MLVPISWIKDYVDIDIPVELLAEKLTVAGLEVAHLRYIGLPQAEAPGVHLKSKPTPTPTGWSWRWSTTAGRNWNNA